MSHPSETAPSTGGGRRESGGGGPLPLYHVPQQSRREKLRYPTPSCILAADPALLFMPPPSPCNFLFTNSPATTTPSPLPSELPYHLFPQRSHVDDDRCRSRHPQQHQQPPPQHHKKQEEEEEEEVLPRGSAEPFTGYAAVLRGSRFLRPARQLLEEMSDVGLGRSAADTIISFQGLGDPDVILPPDLSVGCSTTDAAAQRRRTKTRLISMLHEVCQRYKQYCQQIQDVITSFESVAGLGNVAPYTSLALNSMTRHFRSLKNAISDQLRLLDKALGKEGCSRDEMSNFSFLNGGICYPGSSAHTPGTIIQPNVWRPQRGLPERAVTVLKAWLFEHFLHPYPSDTEKHMLARQTGLSRNQVSNWFINARVRLWKPLVEEIYALEMRQTRKASDQPDNNQCGGGQSDLPSTSTNFHSMEQPGQVAVGLGKNPSTNLERYRNEFHEMSNHTEDPNGFSFSSFPLDGHGGAGASTPNSATGGVSLTLGLHQNNGVRIPETLPFNVARRFGLEDTNMTYAVGGFDAQGRHHGKGIDGQLLRDFGG